MIVSEKMYELGSKRSAIRELFEYGKKRAAEIGAENVYDFSLGNPTVPAPECVNETLDRSSAASDVYKRQISASAIRLFRHRNVSMKQSGS